MKKIEIFEKYNNYIVIDIIEQIKDNEKSLSMNRGASTLLLPFLLCLTPLINDILNILMIETSLDSLLSFIICVFLMFFLGAIGNYLWSFYKVIPEKHEKDIISIISFYDKIPVHIEKEIINILKKNNLNSFYEGLKKSNLIKNKRLYKNTKYFLNKINNNEIVQTEQEKRNIFNRKKIRILKELEKEAKSLGIENKKEVKDIESSEEKNEKKIRIRNF